MGHFYVTAITEPDLDHRSNPRPPLLDSFGSRVDAKTPQWVLNVMS